jgi:methionyl-tRNA formyltransferase
MKIVFLGNHTVGVRTLDTLRKCAEIVGVVAHPVDPEDGERYESVYAYAVSHGLKVIRGSAKSKEVKAFIEDARADLLWVTDYRYLLPLELISLSKLGAINLHPSILPRYRGRAPINWAILQGEDRLGITAHFVDEGMDTGDIIEQLEFGLTSDQDVGDALELYYPLYEEITKRVAGYFQRGLVPRRVQDHGSATVFPARRPEDGRIKWAEPVRNVVNLVRAVAFPYPGAFTYFRGERINIWRARVEVTEGAYQPGKVISVGPDNEFCVSCSFGVLRVLKVQVDSGRNLKINVGDVFDQIQDSMQIHRERTVQFYKEQAATYGVGFRALGWGSRESQELRFKVLCELGIRPGESVLDVGCGQGDLLVWMRSCMLDVRYTGLDVTACLLDTARQRFPDACFQEGDLFEAILSPHDYVVASGIFAHAATDPYQYAERGIARLYKLAQKGVACNFLNMRAPEKDPGEFYADPGRIVNFCRSLTPWVVLREDYHLRDFTVYLYRERQT